MISDPSSPLDEKLAAYDLATGQDACERLLSIDGLPPEVDTRTRRNMVKLAPTLDLVAPSARSWPIRIPAPEGWTIHGASIARAADGFRMIVQSSNWTRNADQTRAIHDDDGIPRGRNVWVELSPDLELRAVHAIQEQAAPSPNVALPSSGLVDGRPVLHADSWWISGATGDAEAGQTRRPLLGRLDGFCLQETVRLAGGVPGDPPWSPVVSADEAVLRFVAGLFPTLVSRYSVTSKIVNLESRHPAPLIARRLRVGSQTIPCDGGSLCLGYEAVEHVDGSRQAVHRWVWLDGHWRLARLSRPFILREHGAEIAAGLTRHGDDLVVSFSQAERDVWIATVPEMEALALLAPPLALNLEAVERQLDDDPELMVRPRRRGASRLNRVARPTIVSLTITGSNRDIVGDALRSVVDWVDWCLLVDTGIEDDTIAVARSIVGDKLIVREFPWCNDFSAARNFALAAAAKTGAAWAVFVDTDERIALNGVDIHAVLAETPEEALIVPHSSGEYTKDRFYRLPATGAFLGPTHEAYYLSLQAGGATVVVPGVIFDELPKSAEQLRAKDERDRDILARHAAATPNEPRWFYYLGDVLQRLGQYEEAIAAFRACTEQRGWNEESALAMYRAAFCLIHLNRLEEALEAAAIGMTRHAGLADLSWLAAFLSLRLGRPQQAVYWARHSIALGWFAGIGQTVPRKGWRYPFALWEGPYDVLRLALKELGDDVGAADATRLFEQAAAARLAQPAKMSDGVTG